ncbi:thiamine phosphate synthase [Chryseobacterium indologenes]|uniref:thiamine phosphate synthase n=1 Tax=Chryseobacterium TaxID=59732 RepID=UPI000481D958|nr:MULTISPECIES: thiamine phosphate synthase [Chryseobacterium]ATN04194.1 thiamine phosphate synthase [Chryseobacterium indologenes]AYY83143.1 thiamine phosphate synthase [Chryseobacterium indologenes]AYZ36960.1 thiamine phosphate synthase [Chryseobacterium indologenes]MBF6645792.1 thiamine phosphate synthase [Chryseobacterium indologenes]MBU3048765.1 thiamine phosphate synthase [Chryseobacterium indologenes]
MRLKTFPYSLYLVISQADCRGKNFLEVAEQAILGGVDIIQLREKNDDTEIFLQKALQLIEVTNKYNIPLIINDNITVAEKANSAGIHVGNHDMAPTELRPLVEDKIIGYSIEDLTQLDNEQTAVADYLGISPVFKTKTKTDTIIEWGLEGINQIRQLTQKPLVAIGNIQVENAKAVIHAGADCLAVVSAICSAADPQKAAYELKNEIVK